MSDLRVLVVGAGLAGLSCARRLHESGAEALVLEAADAVGGRVRTDVVDGFLLDRGFQVLLTAYPECRRRLDYDELDLRGFFPGAMVRLAGRFHTVADPWRRPLAGLRGALAPIGSLGDKLRVARLRRRLLATDLETIFSRPERTSLDALRGEGFSSSMIDRFFRPFLGGIFLERELATSSRMFEFVYKMFSSGDTALPAAGMGAIPRQLAAGLPDGTVRTGCRAEVIRPGELRLASGEVVAGDAVVVAGALPDGPDLGVSTPPTAWCSTTCLYFSAPEPPVRRPVLVLDGEGAGPVNSLCVPSQVTPAYAPPGRALVSASVIGGTPGAALPDDQLESGVFVCGDHRDNASIHGAMVSGRRAAEAVLTDLG